MDSNYGYRYQLITGISLFKKERDKIKKVDESDYVKRSIYHFMKEMNQGKGKGKEKKEGKEKEEEKEFKI